MKVGDEQNCGNCAFMHVGDSGGYRKDFCCRYPENIPTARFGWCGEHTLTGFISRHISKGDYFHATGKDPE